MWLPLQNLILLPQTIYPYLMHSVECVQAREHGVNLASLRDFLGQHFPKKGRSVIMRVASADARGVVPTAVPKYFPTLRPFTLFHRINF